MDSRRIIPVIDLFAGPGGLNEGFSYDDHSGLRFKSVLSIEMDSHAHDTLELRAFYRFFDYKGQSVPDEYYQYVAGKISKQELFAKYRDAYESAKQEAYQATLGITPDEEINQRITKALAGQKDWMLIGGPPCQAYSLAGRVKNMGVCRAKSESEDKAKELFDNDTRQTLYIQYLKIIATHYPAVFVMENVRGILSAKVHGKLIYPKILDDLREPNKAIKSDNIQNQYKYHLLSFVTGDKPEEYADYLIRAEEYGLPQARHRVILLGIRDDVLMKGVEVKPLSRQPSMSVKEAIGDLPELRSGFTDEYDTMGVWKAYLSHVTGEQWVANLAQEVQNVIANAEQERAQKHLETQKSDHKYDATQAPKLGGDWYIDEKLPCYLNHKARSHMKTDLRRYLFVAAYGQAIGRAPILRDFPNLLLPEHKNVLRNGEEGSQKFADRFKVQLAEETSSTVTSHISKDGHYFIHYDPVQCRSLTVREAARLQTFPDNYFFEGNRTEQYHQVGNAVPPYLAKQLADVARDLFRQYFEKGDI